MKWVLAFLLAQVGLCCARVAAQDNPPTPESARQEPPAAAVAPNTMFSGPQVGESLPTFTMAQALGDDRGKPIDVIDRAGNGPVLLVFFGEKSRPAFGLTRAIVRYAATRQQDGLATAVCFLTDDPTETSNWLQNVERYLTPGVQYGITVDGAEGPGAYGINRNVGLTILVADKGKVAHNFALTQPGVAVDGPRILAAIVDVLGSGEVPDINQLELMTESAGAPVRSEPINLRGWLRPVIDKNATSDQVDAAASALEKHIAGDGAARTELRRIAKRIVASGKLQEYGTARAQEYLKKWADQMDPAGDDRFKPEMPDDK